MIGEHRFAPGDKVNWTFETRSGYGYKFVAAGIVIKVAKHRTQITVAVRDLANREWRKVNKWVSTKALTPRTEHVAEIDD